MLPILDRLFSRSAKLFRSTGRVSARGRFTSEQAAEIAARAASGPGVTTGSAVLTRTETGLVWDVCEVAYGGGWRVCVDDATGEPGPVGRWGLR